MSQLLYRDPLCLNKTQLLDCILDVVKEDSKKEFIEQGKPEDKIEGMVNGKINKFIKKVCFEEQDYDFEEKDAKTIRTISQVLKENNIVIFEIGTI